MEARGKKRNNHSDIIDLTNLVSIIIPPLQRERHEDMAEFVDLTSPDFIRHLIPKSSYKTKKRKRSSIHIIDLTEEYQKTDSGNKQIDKCAFCRINIPQETKDEHLKSCEGLQNLFDPINPIDEVNVQAIGDTNKRCPICKLNLSDDIKSHVDDCLKSFGLVNIFDEPTLPLTDGEDDSSIFTANSNNKRPNLALSDISDETILEISDSELPITACDGEIQVSGMLSLNSVPKPKLCCVLCGLHFEGNMKSHLNFCQNNACIFDNDESVIELCNDESPVKIVGCHTKVPKPMTLDIDNSESPLKIAGYHRKVPKPMTLDIDDSEERRTCYTCGMRFGLSRIADHICIS